MLLDKGFRFPIRASVEHLDPELYYRLEPGDELVLYTPSCPNGLSDDLAHNGPRANALCARLGARNLAWEISDVSCTHMAWEIVDARDRTQADDVSSAAE